MAATTSDASGPSSAPGPSGPSTASARTGQDVFELGGETFGSRLIMGTGGAPSLEILERALLASGTELTTVALRRISTATSGSVLEVLARHSISVLPNTAGL